MTIGNHHILVVDDNEDILFMLKAMLQFNDYKVTISSTPENIQSLIREDSPHIILMDMLLSGSDGREVCRKLKADPEFAAIPVIMISALPQAREMCVEAGADYFIAKPFEMNDLFETVAIAVTAKMN